MRSGPTKINKKPPLLWVNIVFFASTLLISLLGIIWCLWLGKADLTIWLAGLFALTFCELSITAGYHRLWSHNAYEANDLVKCIFAIGGAFSVQNSILHWSSDHRMHHKFVDQNDKDPYSAKKGFWYSHIGWMLRAYQAHRYRDYKNVADLAKDKIVMWQHKYYLALAFTINMVIPLFFGFLTGKILESFLIIGFLRLVLSHHLTFCINSLAHMWGSQPYSTLNTAKDNPIVAFLTFGEGYHNFHHAFQYDYRNAIRWWQFDPTKWLIDILSLLGMAKNLKKISEEKILKAVLTQELYIVKSRLIIIALPEKDEIIIKLQKEYEILISKMQEYYGARKKWLEMEKNKINENVEKLKMHEQIENLKSSWLEQKKNWQVLIHQYA